MTFIFSSIKATFFMNTVLESSSGLSSRVPKCGPPILYHQNGRRKAKLVQISFDQVNQNNHNIYNLQQSLKHKKGRERQRKVEKGRERQRKVEKGRPLFKKLVRRKVSFLYFLCHAAKIGNQRRLSRFLIPTFL